MTNGDGWTNVEIPRDRNKRPLVMNLAGTKRIAYQRTTKFIDVLEDTYNLERYKMRNVAWGMAQRDDLVLLASSCSPEDKSTLNDVAWQAQEYARSQAKANKGTGLHKLTERMDRGETLGRVPPPHGDDLKAYERRCRAEGVETHVIESFRVNDNWQVAGTTDRIWKIGGEYYIADIKTGDIDWGALKMAMQLAMYRRSKPYDIPSDTRGEDTVQISTKRAIICHLPSGEARCDFYWLDIEKGWTACLVAKNVWMQRKVKREQVIWPMSEQGELGIETEPVTLADKLLHRIGEITDMDELRELYHHGVGAGADTPQFIAAVKQRKAYLAGAE